MFPPSCLQLPFQVSSACRWLLASCASEFRSSDEVCGVQRNDCTNTKRDLQLSSVLQTSHSQPQRNAPNSIMLNFIEVWNCLVKSKPKPSLFFLAHRLAIEMSSVFSSTLATATRVRHLVRNFEFMASVYKLAKKVTRQLHNAQNSDASLAPPPPRPFLVGVTGPNTCENPLNSQLIILRVSSERFDIFFFSRERERERAFYFQQTRSDRFKQDAECI